ncbi:MAG: sigma-70 family RNA polymerase sigma factor [Gemmatimonadaceae bacterium]
MEFPIHPFTGSLFEAATRRVRVAMPAALQQVPGTMEPSASTTVSDKDLVAQLALGDDRALAELYDRHSSVAYSLARAIVRDPNDAEEVVADAFAQIWRTAATFDPTRGAVVAWITTIVRTRSLDLIRAQRRRARVVEDAAQAGAADDPIAMGSSGPSPDRELERSDAGALVRQSLAELPAPQRRVLELAYFGGMSQSEIAALLDEPLGTVKTRMRAGLEKLRAALRPLMEATP